MTSCAQHSICCLDSSVSETVQTRACARGIECWNRKLRSSLWKPSMPSFWESSYEAEEDATDVADFSSHWLCASGWQPASEDITFEEADNMTFDVASGDDISFDVAGDVTSVGASKVEEYCWDEVFEVADYAVSVVSPKAEEYCFDEVFLPADSAASEGAHMFRNYYEYVLGEPSTLESSSLPPPPPPHWFRDRKFRAISCRPPTPEPKNTMFIPFKRTRKDDDEGVGRDPKQMRLCFK